MQGIVLHTTWSAHEVGRVPVPLTRVPLTRCPSDPLRKSSEQFLTKNLK